MTVKRLINDFHDDELNFKGLFEYMKEKNIPISLVDFKIKALGLAAYDRIYISNIIFDLQYGYKDLAFFVIAHEIAHFFSYNKKGLQTHLDFLSSNDFDLVSSHIINEEILADRFATLLFYKLNKQIYKGPQQNLHLEHKKSDYMNVIRNTMFGVYSNRIEDFQKSVDSLILS